MGRIGRRAGGEDNHVKAKTDLEMTLSQGASVASRSLRESRKDPSRFQGTLQSSQVRTEVEAGL